MSNISPSPADIISLLADIQDRSKKSAIRLVDEDNSLGTWTAIGFRINNNNYLIPLSETREIFPIPRQISTVPRSAAWVFGIANLRGELLPLFDLNHFLYGKATKINKQNRIIVNNHVTLYSGLLIDEVFGLKHFQHEPEYSVSSTTADSAIAPYILGNITQADTHWDVFSFNKLTADQRFLNVAQ